MLKEPESSPEYQPMPSYSFDDTSGLVQENNEYEHLRDLVQVHFAIASTENMKLEDLAPEDRALLGAKKQKQGNPRLVISYTGYLKEDAETAYKELDKALAPDNMYPLFRTNPDDVDAAHIIHIIEGRAAEQADWAIWPNILLFILTILSVLFTGATIAISQIGLDDPARAEAMGSSILSIFSEIWRGWPYALAIMLILVSHEMGHYLMMRRYGLKATLPYFIPAWLISPFGTFGAAIVIRDSLKNRKTLLDVGAAGPIAGFIIAVPVVFIGLATSRVIPLSPGGFVEGNSLLYAFAKFVVFGKILPNSNVDVLVNQLAWAGWTGLFVTTLNLLPVGQLDGGHILYSLFGHHARKAYWPVLIGLLAISLLFGQLTWGLIWIMLYFFGRFYAVPLNDITALNPTRRWIAISAIVIFILSFTPVPIYVNNAGTENLSTAFHAGMISVAALIVLPRWWRMRHLAK